MKLREACPQDWLYWSKSCYVKPADLKKCYDQALKHCHKFNATLANPESEEENLFLYDIFVTQPEYQRTYIGVIRKKKGSKTFVTSEGKPQKYFNWGYYEPNNAGWMGENCVEFRNKWWQTEVWNDIRCREKLPFICKFSK